MEVATPMSQKLEGKLAIITGGASGIGEATARLFAKEGARMVVIADIQDELGQSVASSIGAHHCTYIHCDVSNENQVKSMVESTVKNYGHLDIMFSNAEIANRGQTLLELDLSSMDHLFAKEGAHMDVIGDIQDKPRQSVASSIGAHHCTYIHCDVSDEIQVKSMVESTVKSYAHLDIMFSNAGIRNRGQTLLELDLSSMDHLFAINVRGMATCVKYAARAMVEGGVKGSIVCTASAAAKKGIDDGMQDYIMSKNAVLGLIRTGSCELGKYGIRINCVSPGGVATPITMQYFGMTKKEHLAEMFSKNCSLIMLKANHVADAVSYLASDQSAFVTGHELVVDGGYLRL